MNQVILLHAVGDRELDLCLVSVASACRVATMPWSRRKYIQELDTLGEIQIDSFTSFMNLGSAQGCISSTWCVSPTFVPTDETSYPLWRFNFSTNQMCASRQSKLSALDSSPPAIWYLARPNSKHHVKTVAHRGEREMHCISIYTQVCPPDVLVLQ